MVRERGSAVEERVLLWWKTFSEEVFPMLVPYRKWMRVEDSLDLGAIVLVQYASRMAKDRYRMGRVIELIAGRDGVVRSARVRLRDRRRGAREHLLECKAGTTTLVLPVQRLVILLPGAEQPSELVRELERRDVSTDEGVAEEVGGPGVRLALEGEEVIDLL